MNQTTERRALKLVQRLYTRTTDGTVKWEAAPRGRVAAAFDDYWVVLYSLKDPEYPDTPDYFLEIQDSDEREIETISNYTFRPFNDEVYQGLSPYQLLEALFKSARRAALGADKALDSLLSQLGDD